MFSAHTLAIALTVINLQVLWLLLLLSIPSILLYLVLY